MPFHSLEHHMPIDLLRQRLSMIGAQSPVAGADCSALAANMSLRDAILELLGMLPALPDLDAVMLGAPRHADRVKRQYAAMAVLRVAIEGPA